MATQQSPRDKRSETSVVADPMSVKLQIAERNKQLAEERYKASVRRGRAWGIGPKAESFAPLPQRRKDYLDYRQLTTILSAKTST